MKFSNHDKHQKCKEILIDNLLEKTKSQILEGKTSNFENILQKSKDRYGIVQ